MTLPLYTETLHVRRDALKSVSLWVGLDGGSSLTKVAFVPRGTECNELLEIHLCTFDSGCFDEALKYLRDKAWLPDDHRKRHTCSFFSTGITAIKERNLFRKTFPAWKFIFVNENAAHTLGLHFLIVNATDAATDLFYDSPSVTMKLKGFSCVRDSQIMHVIFGSRLTALRMFPNGDSEVLEEGLVGTRSLLHLSSLLVGLSDYEELMEEAARGDISAIDAEVEDLVRLGGLTCSEDTAPFDCTGSAAKRRKIADHRREDIAAALVALFAHFLAKHIKTLITTTDIKVVFVSGNTTRAPTFRHFFHKDFAMMCPERDVSVLFLRTSSLGALGVMNFDDDAQ